MSNTKEKLVLHNFEEHNANKVAPKGIFSSYYRFKGKFIWKEEQRSFTSVLLVFVLLRM